MASRRSSRQSGKARFIPREKRTVQSHDWHTKPELNDTLDTYYRNYCKQPSDEAATKAKKKHDDVIDFIRKGLKRQWKIQRLEFTGSSYEGVKVNDGLEFDVMFVMNGEDLTIRNVEPGFVELHGNAKEGDLSAQKKRRAFQSSVQKVINECEQLKTRTVLSLHGPAVQMDVYEEDRRKDSVKWFSVDLVLAYEIQVGSEKHLYVAKTLPGQNDITGSTWRRSFSIEEKEKFNQMDEDNGRRKQCLRVLKVLRNRTGMKLTSYHLKTLLFHEMERQQDWGPERIAVRVLDLLTHLKESLECGQLRHFFLPEMNLVDEVEPQPRLDMVGQIKKILNSEASFNKTFRYREGLPTN